MQPKCLETQPLIAPRSIEAVSGPLQGYLLTESQGRESSASLTRRLAARFAADRWEGRSRYLFEAAHATPEKLATIVVTIQ
jgi:hypothetical protein